MKRKTNQLQISVNFARFLQTGSYNRQNDNVHCASTYSRKYRNNIANNNIQGRSCLPAAAVVQLQHHNRGVVDLMSINTPFL